DLVGLANRAAEETVASVSDSATSQTQTISPSPAPAQAPATPSEKPAAPPSDAEQYRDPVTGVVPDGPTIVMVTSSVCPPCQQWWAQRGEWETRGWTVLKVDVGNVPGIRLTPTFRVFHHRKWHPHTGYMWVDA